MIFSSGIVVCLIALIVIGISGNVRRNRRPWFLQAGLVAMFAGIMIAAFSSNA